MMMRAYRFRLGPGAEQEERLRQFAGARRFIWNWALQQRREYYQQTGKTLPANGLARSISDAAWAPFIAIVTYKAAEAGRQVIAVNPRNTSQACICGEPVPKDLGDRWHDCPNCHLSLPRDQVSAMLIKGLGLSLRATAA